MTNPEEEGQSSACKNNREYGANNKHEERGDPLKLQDPVPITFGVLKKEEEGIKEEDDSPNIIDAENLQHTSTDVEYESNTKFKSSYGNTDCKQIITKKILNYEKQTSKVLVSFEREHDEDKYNGTKDNNNLNFLHKSKKYKKKYRCQDCHMKFPRLTNLRKHIFVHRTDYEQQLLPVKQHGKKKNCKSMSGFTTEKLNFHQMDKKYICSICRKRYTDYMRLKYHIEAIHLELSDYKCKKCYKTYSTIYTLSNHTRFVHSVNRYKYECYRTFQRAC